MAAAPPDGFIRKQFDGPPFGNCYVTIDPGGEAPFASANKNRVYLCGRDAGMDAESIRHLVDLFAGQGIKRFFVWLSPGPDMELVRGCSRRPGFHASGAPVIRRYAASAMRRFNSTPISKSARSVSMK